MKHVRVESDEEFGVREVHSMAELRDDIIENLKLQDDEGAHIILQSIVEESCDQLGIAEDEVVDGSCCISSAATTLVNLWERSKKKKIDKAIDNYLENN